MSDFKVGPNTKYRCENCGAIEDRSPADLEGRRHPCRSCGGMVWVQIVIVPKCDFCGSEDHSEWWTFPTEDFRYTMQVPGQPGEYSKGDWAACPDCKDAVCANDRRKLAQRALDHEMHKNPSIKTIRNQLFAVIRMGHNDFFDHRTGEPTLDGKDMIRE